jgi:uncharacterized protein
MFGCRLLISLLSYALLLSLTGCLGGNSPPAQFYLLEPIVTDSATPPGDAKKPVLVLAPVRIPHYLDRAQIVTATGENTYQLSELNRWAEGLDQNITRVLQQDLSHLVPADVLQVPGPGTTPMKLSVTILEFHVDAQGQAGLTAQWQLSRDNQLLGNRQQAYHEAASKSDYRQMVAALNNCLHRLSRDLAATVQQANQN